MSYPALANMAALQSSSMAGFNHGLGSINEDDGDKGKDYGADTFSLIAKRLDLNGSSLLKSREAILSHRSILLSFTKMCFIKL